MSARKIKRRKYGKVSHMAALVETWTALARTGRPADYGAVFGRMARLR